MDKRRTHKQGLGICYNAEGFIYVCIAVTIQENNRGLEVRGIFDAASDSGRVVIVIVKGDVVGISVWSSTVRGVREYAARGGGGQPGSAGRCSPPARGHQPILLNRRKQQKQTQARPVSRSVLFIAGASARRARTAQAPP